MNWFLLIVAVGCVAGYFDRRRNQRRLQSSTEWYQAADGSWQPAPQHRPSRLRSSRTALVIAIIAAIAGLVMLSLFVLAAYSALSHFKLESNK